MIIQYWYWICMEIGVFLKLCQIYYVLLLFVVICLCVCLSVCLCHQCMLKVDIHEPLRSPCPWISLACCIIHFCYSVCSSPTAWEIYETLKDISFIQFFSRTSYSKSVWQNMYMFILFIFLFIVYAIYVYVSLNVYLFIHVFILFYLFIVNFYCISIFVTPSLFI